MADLGRLVDDVRVLVECESPSHDLQAVGRSADAVAALGLTLLGEPAERLVIEGTAHLRWRLGSGPRRVLFLAHHDTVWPIGSLAKRPFAAEGGVLRGPGVLDMKAGLAIGLHALAGLGPDRRDGVTLLVTGDEELGSPTSRSLIEDEARGMSAALVLEASADDGGVKVARKGVSTYRISVAGRAAHAGLEPERGVNAAIELAELTLAVAALSDPGAGTTVTPTVAAAGTTANTVPAGASLTVDVRAWTADEQRRVDAGIRSMSPFLAGAAIAAEGGVNRPPLEESASRALFRRAALVAGRLGMPPLTGAAVGGGSDGSFTAAAGTPTLDGLGAVGGGAHADDEHVLVDSLLPREALIRGMLEDLLGERAN